MANITTIEEYREYANMCAQKAREIAALNMGNSTAISNRHFAMQAQNAFANGVSLSPNMSEELVRHIIDGDIEHHRYGKIGLAKNTYVNPEVLDTLYDVSPAEIQIAVLGNANVSDGIIENGLVSDNLDVRKAAEERVGGNGATTSKARERCENRLSVHREDDDTSKTLTVNSDADKIFSRGKRVRQEEPEREQDYEMEI